MPTQYIAGTVWLHLAVIAFLSTQLQIVSALPSGRVSQVLSPAQHPGRFHIFPTFSVTSDSGTCADLAVSIQSVLNTTTCIRMYSDDFYYYRSEFCTDPCFQDFKQLFQQFFEAECTDGTESPANLERFLCPTQTTSDQAQKLLEFKNSLANADCIPTFSSWSAQSADAPCDWEGVKCWEGGFFSHLVESIKLPSASTPLAGTLSSALSDVYTIAEIDLSNNDLCGPLPTGLLDMPLLVLLMIHGNNQLCDGLPGKLPIPASFPLDSIGQTCGVCPNKDSWVPQQDLKDQAALLKAFRNALPLSQYIQNLVAWTGDNPCTWPGVTCWTDGLYIGKVRRVELPNQYPKLVGAIAGELALVQTLESIDLSGNDLCGLLPDFSGRLSCFPSILKTLDIHGNAKLRSAYPVSESLLKNTDGLDLHNTDLAPLCPPDLSALPCDAGSHLDPQDYICQSCQPCSQEHHFRSGCGGPFDGVCTNCSDCIEGRYRANCGGATEGSCDLCPGCGLGRFRENCSYTSSGVCSDCPKCGKGSFSLGCNGISQGDCVPCESCPTGEYRAECSDQLSGHCETCGTCAAGFFRDGCSGVDEGSCKLCAFCPDGQYRENCGVSDPGSCAVCPDCPFGYYRSGCSNTSLGMCLPCNSCQDGTYRAGCSGRSEGVCASCDTCDEGSMRVECSDLNAGYCQLCEPCKIGFYRGSCPGECLPYAGCDSGFWRVD